MPCSSAALSPAATTSSSSATSEAALASSGRASRTVSLRPVWFLTAGDPSSVLITLARRGASAQNSSRHPHNIPT